MSRTTPCLPPLLPADLGIGRLFEQIHEAAVVAEVGSGRVVLWNPAAERLFGYTSDAAVGQLIVDLIVPERLREAHRAGLARYRQAGHGPLVDSSRAVELPACTRTGEELAVELTLGTLDSVSTRGRFVLGLIRDVTERKRAEAERAALACEQAARAEAEAALRERNQVLATVSHDLKAPLTTIRGQAALLQRHAQRTASPELEQTLQGLRLIETAAVKMATWIDELLDAARLEAGRPLELNREPTDLLALARQAAAEQQQTTERHRLRVETGELQLIGVWDPVRLGRVLDNLLANALKYSPAGGEVTVSVAREPAATGTWAVLRVHDEGVGIPAADQPDIFERYRRGANVVGRIAGTGIGLAGAAQLAEQHGGTLAVESREGAGSTFILRLPLAPLA
jgi:PAS domain S-box-containing protein